MATAKKKPPYEVKETSYDANLKTLYNSLDPTSISELFAFYRLYPETVQGRLSIQKALSLMQKHAPKQSQVGTEKVQYQFPTFDLQPIISLVNRKPYEDEVALNEDEIAFIEKAAGHLSNRKLKGHNVWDIDSLVDLTDAEVDLSHALFLHQFEEFPNRVTKIRQYEAMLDMMALQILARLPKNPTHTEKLRAISEFIFHQMRFRFPPHSMWAKEVDHYTFLPSVMDNRHGVCLGVSILYLSLAQRIDLPLRIFTPPGHIYISYDNGKSLHNIETTARGIHVPTDSYLSINTKIVKERSLKQVIGLNFINQAAVLLHKRDYKNSLHLYRNAERYIREDHLLNTLMSYNLLVVGEIEEGKRRLQWLIDHPNPEMVVQDTIPQDFLSGKVDPAGIQVIFQEVDDTRESIFNKQNELQATLKKNPEFRDGIFHLAITWLQLGRTKEALQVLSDYSKKDPNNPIVEYYLTVLNIQRFNYAEAWKHARQAQQLVAKANYSPKSLEELTKHLKLLCPSFSAS
ncbi:MAG: hypothetical protein S4CHLAM102_07800 [Chlamydiia bacterium]|nr:hypothetical protein [Chlamydiia bacterium]